ncbi:L-ascorbate peroxidase 2, cytosolic [Galdieria sulphuraria]|nr:L-ascorbate peroxidase 2, cytosolic [Galdieria sulphuraria]
MPFASQFPCISIADLINSCAVTALKFLGGPEVPVYYGRLDRNVPDPAGLIPEPTMSLSALISAFNAIGFTKENVVTLSGAHSVGVCHGVPMCPGHNNTFGNHYYKELIDGDFEGKLGTDIELLDDNTMRSLVQQYANDQQQFFDDFTTVPVPWMTSVYLHLLHHRNQFNLYLLNLAFLLTHSQLLAVNRQHHPNHQHHPHRLHLAVAANLFSSQYRKSN